MWPGLAGLQGEPTLRQRPPWVGRAVELSQAVFPSLTGPVLWPVSGVQELGWHVLGPLPGEWVVGHL